MKCLLILSCVCIFCNSEDLSSYSVSILSLTKTIIKYGWDLVEDRSVINMPNSTARDKGQKIFQNVSVLDGHITWANQLVANVNLEDMLDAVRYWAQTDVAPFRFSQLITHIHEINGAYERMLSYVTSENGINPAGFKNFSQSSVNSDQCFSVKMVMKQVNNILVPPRKDIWPTNLIELFSTAKDLDDSVCKSRQSPNQLLYNLYNMISLTYIKAYAMLQLSYTLLEIYDIGSFSIDSAETRIQFLFNMKKITQEIQTTLNKTALQFRRCDPKKYQSGVNYLEVTKLMQGYISNEIALNKKGACRENCTYYKETKHYNCMNDMYCREEKICRGSILNCRDVPSQIQICLSNSSDSRRYEYIEYPGGKILGQKGYCRKKSEVDGWYRAGGWTCSYCMCLCDEENTSDRVFSLRFAASDAMQNRVVTGIRFVKKNRIIHLQIQQGELLPYGVINETTLEWPAIDNFTIEDMDHYDSFKLNWAERAIDLDTLIGKDDNVLTGVRFSVISSHHLTFEIRVTPFNFETGKLIDPKKSSEWIFNLNTEHSSDKRTQINLKEPDVPTKAPYPSKVISNHNEFIQFTHTDFEKDAAQTTVPFLDAQDVVPVVPIPISGAGVYFKSTEGYGGFIGLKLVTYNFGKHLNYD